MSGAEPLARWHPALPNRIELSAAALTAAASLTPSLLPKPPLIQGVVTGVAATIGYAIGALIHLLLIPLLRRLPERAVDVGEWVLLGVSAFWLALAAWFARTWQRELALSVGETDPPSTNVVVALLVATGVVMAAVLLTRGLRWLVHWADRQLSRLMPAWLAAVVAVVLVALASVAVAERLVNHGLLAWADRTSRTFSRQSRASAPAPTDALRSGGPGSLVSWSTMGRAGRIFMSLPVPAGVRDDPVRVYAGIDSAPDVAARADLVVAELDRTGGLTRGVLCLIVPTGTGWVDPAAVTSLEALWSGNSAIASMQYSFLPSPLSFLSDRQRVDAAATALLGAVVRRWSALPAPRRPRLVLYGESLGSRGVEAAMAAVPGARDAVSGVLIAGPPNSNPTWSYLVAHREAGSPMLAPVVDGGRSVRFWPGPEMPGYDRTHDPWPAPPSGPRTLYLQHPSDPVVWWSLPLLWDKPAWVDERATVSRAPPLRWRPVVTFWQIGGDAIIANQVPQGHGHRYGAELPAAWAAVAPPPPG